MLRAAECTIQPPRLSRYWSLVLFLIASNFTDAGLFQTDIYIEDICALSLMYIVLEIASRGTVKFLNTAAIHNKS